LQIKTLQIAPKDLDKLQALLKAKERENLQAIHIEDIKMKRELEVSFHFMSKVNIVIFLE
jgi:hypothetical protein